MKRIKIRIIVRTRGSKIVCQIIIYTKSIAHQNSLILKSMSCPYQHQTINPYTRTFINQICHPCMLFSNRMLGKEKGGIQVYKLKLKCYFKLRLKGNLPIHNSWKGIQLQQIYVLSRAPETTQHHIPLTLLQKSAWHKIRKL